MSCDSSCFPPSLMPQPDHLPAFFRHLLSGPLLDPVSHVEWGPRFDQLAVVVNKSLLLLRSETVLRVSKIKNSCLTFDTTYMNIDNVCSEDAVTDSQSAAAFHFPALSEKKQQEMLKRLDSEGDVLLAKMDRLICYDASSRNSESYASIRAVKWTPHPKQDGRSILAVLTCSSGILLFVNRIASSKWINLSRVQDYLSETLRNKRQDSLLSNVKSYEQLKQHFYRTGITALTWFRLCDAKQDEELTFLITVSKSGFFYWWRLSYGQEKDSEEDVSLTLSHEWDSGLGQVSSMHPFSDYLIIGTHSGQLVAVNLRSFLLSEGGVDPVFVWREKDELPLEHFLVYRSSPAPPATSPDFLIVFPKGTFLVLVQMSLHEKEEEVNGRQEVVLEGRHQMPVTGMCKVEGKSDDSPIAFLISSADGLLIHVQLPVDAFATAVPHIQQEEVTVEGLLKSRSTIYGLTSSPFRLFTAALQTIASYRDTSIVKEGSLVLIFPNISFHYVTQWLSHREQHADSCSPDQTIEFVMAYRSFLDKADNKGTEAFETQFLKRPDLTSRDIPCLKVTRHKILALRSLLSTRDPDKIHPDSQLLDDTLISIERQVLQQHVLHLNKSFASRMGLEGATQHQKDSLSLMRLWYKKVTSKDLTPTPGRGKRNTAQTSGQSLESCPICSQEIAFQDERQASCPAGHVFARCSSSLLLCDPLSCSIDVCFLCRRTYRWPRVWSSPYSCIYCY